MPLMAKAHRQVVPLPPLAQRGRSRPVAAGAVEVPRCGEGIGQWRRAGSNGRPRDYESVRPRFRGAAL